MSERNVFGETVEQSRARYIRIIIRLVRQLVRDGEVEEADRILAELSEFVVKGVE